MTLIHELIMEEGYTITKSLAERLKVSERTLYNDLEIVEDYLISNGYPLNLDRKKGTGIRLNGLPHEKEKLMASISQSQSYYFSKQELQKLIIFHILQLPNGKISQEELAEQLYVNRKTIQENLKVIKPYLEQYGIKIISRPGVGTQVIGSEQEKRKLLVRTLREMKRSDSKSPTLKEFFKQDTLEIIKNIVCEVLQQNDDSSAVDLLNIETHIYFMLERMKSKNEVILTDSEMKAVENSKAQELSSQVLAKLSSVYPIDFSPNEINYLALRIASTFPFSRTELYFDKEAEGLTAFLIEQLDDILGYSLSKDRVLKKNLMSHLSSTYFRLNFNLNISNPLTENVFNTYPQLFMVIQLTVDDYFKQREGFIPQEEVAYLVIHFQASIERQKYQKSRIFKVGLISEYSKAMASFIEARINRELPEIKVVELFEYKEGINFEVSQELDFILSTVTLSHYNIPVITISPMITESDVLDVEKYLLEHGERIQKKHFDLASFTHPFLIYPQIQLEKPEEILNFMGKMLVANHYVEEQFVSEVLKRDKYSSTRVAPEITLPHANPNFVCKSTLSIATLKEPVNWNGELIRLVILIAVKKEELKNPEFKKLFSVIHYISQSPELMEKLCQIQNPLEILNMLSIYE